MKNCVNYSEEKQETEARRREMVDNKQTKQKIRHRR
jgi:hypothetical protein